MGWGDCHVHVILCISVGVTILYVVHIGGDHENDVEDDHSDTGPHHNAFSSVCC